MKTSSNHSLSALALLGLIVALGGCGKSPPGPAQVPQDTANTSDVDVTTKVQTALLGDEQLKGLDITVVTLKGDVRLTGVVDSQAQIDRALVVARSADGMHAIHDELTLKK
jgi:hyperosmotically inducible periplasmic protein